MTDHGGDALILDCGDCEMRDTSACQECVVSFVLNRPEGAVIFDADEERALRSLAGGGLLPAVRYRRTAG